MAKHSKKPGRSRDRGVTRVTTVEFDVPLGDALDAHCKREMRSKKSVIVRALQEYLGRHGDWPPKEEA